MKLPTNADDWAESRKSATAKVADGRSPVLDTFWLTLAEDETIAWMAFAEWRPYIEVAVPPRMSDIAVWSEAAPTPCDCELRTIVYEYQPGESELMSMAHEDRVCVYRQQGRD